MKMGEGKECYLNLTFEETGSTVTTNMQIVLDRQLVRNEYWYKICMIGASTTYSFTLTSPCIHLLGEVCVVPLHVALTVALPNNIN